MINSELERDKWMRAEYPYDLATCFSCAAMHGRNTLLRTFGGCPYPTHKPLRTALRRARLNKFPFGTRVTASQVKKFLTIRKKFAKFFLVNP